LEKERTGSSQYAISKFIEDKHKAHLPPNFKRLILVQLRKFTAAGRFTKVKNSYKISVKPSAAKKPTAAATTVRPKSAAAKVKKVAVRPKPRSVAVKTKSKPAAPKPKTKTVAKSKTAAPKPKIKTVAKSKTIAPKLKAAGRLAKAAKTSSKAAPGKKSDAAAVAPKKPAPVAARKPRIPL